MNKVVFLFLCLPILVARGQQDLLVTDRIMVSGEVKNELLLTVTEIERHPSQPIGDVVITNHRGDPRGTARNLSGILVKDLLKEVELKEENPKLFSEFYLVFVAADQYKVVFSWNELFNSPTGENLYLITSRDGKELREMEERLLILSPTDFKTGRRHIKGLEKIIVRRVAE